MADILNVAGQRQLFVDDYVIEEARGITHVMNQPTKYSGNPIVRPTHPWERRVEVFSAVMHDPEQEVYKMWYIAFEKHGTPTYKGCYAISRDGIYWDKPRLGLVEFGGSKDNNIVLDGSGISNVIKDSHEEDPDRLYKALFYESVRPAVSVVFSPDGLRWTRYRGNPVLTNASDTHTVLGWDENHDKYVAYIRPAIHNGNNMNDVGSAPLRVIGRSVSDDFVHWTETQVVLAPDEEDPPGLEFYGMPVVKYEGVYLGMLWTYHTNPEDPPVRSAGTSDVQLAVSRDGVSWKRVGDRMPFVPLGPPGSVDQSMVYAREPLVVGDELWFYYTASDADHGLRRPILVQDERPFQICLAKLRLDGFVSMEARAQEGTLLTKPFHCEGGRLSINASARGGSIAVAVLDELGVAIEGYRKIECSLFDGDSTAHPVTWRESLSLDPLRGQTIRLKFYLWSAKLYSFAIP